MSWAAILGLAAASYALKAIGPVLLAGRGIAAPTQAVLDLAAVPLLAALIVVQSATDGRSFTADARLPAMAVAGVLVWRRAPFLVVIGAAALTAALLRQL